MKHGRTIKGCVGAAVLTGLLAMSANAFIVVDWQTSAALLQAAPSATPVVDGALVQLIWSPDAIIDDISATGSATPVGGDMVLDTIDIGIFRTSNIGAPASDFPNGQPGIFTAQSTEYANDALGGDLTTGWVYLRAFDSAAPTVGNWYRESDAAIRVTTDPGRPSDYDYLDLAPGGGAYNVNMQLVPEPGTMALFGLGLATLAIRRKIKK